MARYLLGVIFIFSLVVPSVSQDWGAEPMPVVSLALPYGVESETVQVHYFMTGTFGGMGGLSTGKKNSESYAIAASVHEQPAQNVKVIAYLPRCEIVALDIAVEATRIERQLPCNPLGTVSLLGQIFPVSITQKEPTEIEVSYLATWSHEFFGILDGPVTTIRVESVNPDANGEFTVDVPDFYEQELRDGAFQLLLRHRTTKNIIAFLRPVDATAEGFSLKVNHSYAPVVQFMAEER